MTEHNVKRPEIGEFAMVGTCVLALVWNLGFTAAVAPAAGLLILVGGIASAIRVGRWALDRFGSNNGPPSFA